MRVVCCYVYYITFIGRVLCPLFMIPKGMICIYTNLVTSLNPFGNEYGKVFDYMVIFLYIDSFALLKKIKLCNSNDRFLVPIHSINMKTYTNYEKIHTKTY